MQEFSSLVFKFGGQIIHGCHPTLTPILVEQSKRFGSDGKTKKLNLAVSDFFEEQSSSDWCRWRKSANLEVTPRTGDGKEHLDPSLAILREKMANQCNVFVAIGGLWWKDFPGRAGIPKEFELAKSRSRPCFLLGGFGGALSSYIEDNPSWDQCLNNQLSQSENQRLAREEEFSLAAGRLVAHLNQISLEEL